MARLFISYAGPDRDTAVYVKRWLDNAGHSVFLNVDPGEGFSPAEEWKGRLYAELRRADALIALVSQQSRVSRWCALEIGIAESLGLRIVPLSIDHDAIEPLLEASQHGAYIKDPDAALRAAERVLLEIGPTRVGWPDGQNPYPGLIPFDSSWQRVFFGRRRDLDRLVRSVRSPATWGAPGVLVVVGPSGCGKSSLVRAGLIPEIGAEEEWLALPAIVPGLDPVTQVAAELTREANRRGGGWSLRDVRTRLRLDPTSLADLMQELLVLASAERRRTRLLLVVDQFEELVTLTPAHERKQVGELLRSATIGPATAIATVRPEFLDTVLACRDLGGLPLATFALRPLDHQALSEVVRGPARVAGIRIDGELVARLVNDTGAGEALPLLAYTLAQLAAGVPRGGELSDDSYERLGGVAGALAKQADAALQGATKATVRADRDIFTTLLRLVDVDDLGRLTRRRVNLDTLSTLERAELEPFVARRLLSTTMQNAVTYVEATHESFFRDWPPLAKAVANANQAIRARRQVEVAAHSWARNDHARAALWVGGQLASALDQLGARLGSVARASTKGHLLPAVDLDDVGTRFIRASIRHDRRQRYRAIGILTILLTVSMVATGVAITQARQATQEQRVAIARQLVAQAQIVGDADLRAAVELQLAAHHIYPGPETSAALLETLDTNTMRGVTLSGHNDGIAAVGYSPDGQTMATASSDHTVRLWDITNAERPRQLGTPLATYSHEVTVASFDATGRTLYTSTPAGPIVSWDITDEARPRRLREIGVEGELRLFALSATREVIAAIGESAITVWSVEDREQPRILSAPQTRNEPARSASFDGEGNTLAIGYDAFLDIWDFSDPTNPVLMVHELPAPAQYIAQSTDGDLLATGGENVVTLWNVSNRASPHQIGKKELSSLGTGSPVALSPDGGYLSVGEGPYVSIMDLRATDPLSHTVARLKGHRAYVSNLTFSPNGQYLASGTTGTDKTAILWNTKSVSGPRMLARIASGHSDMLSALAIDENRHMLASGAADGRAMLWDVADPATPKRIGGVIFDGETTDGDVIALAFRDDGRLLVVIRYGALEIWNVADPQAPYLVRKSTFELGFASIAISRDTTRMAIGHIQEITIWDLTDPLRTHVVGRVVPRKEAADEVHAISLNADGSRLAAGVGPHLQVWNIADPATPRIVGSAESGGQLFRAIDFSSDNHVLVTSSPARVWTMSPEPRALGGTFDASAVNSFAGPDNRTVVTSAFASSPSSPGVRFWDIADLARPRRITVAPPYVSGVDDFGVAAVTFADDGRLMAQGGRGGDIVLWDLEPVVQSRLRFLDYACAFTAGGPDEGKWTQYIQGIRYEPTCAASR